MHTHHKARREHIKTLLDTLPAESLMIVERFVQFLHSEVQQAHQDKPTPYLFETKLVPASQLAGRLTLLETGYEGDALADTEALYEDVASL